MTDFDQSRPCLFGCCSFNGVLVHATLSLQSEDVRSGEPGDRLGVIMGVGLEGVLRSDAMELSDDDELLLELFDKPKKMFSKIDLIFSNVRLT